MFLVGTHTAYHTNPQHLATARLAQGKLWSKYESCAAVPHHLTVAWHSRRAAWMLHQRVDCTDARPSTYRPHGLGQQRKYHERLVRALLASAHRVGAHLEKRIVQGPATARRRSVLGNRRPLRHGQLSSPWRSGRRFASFQRQRAPAGPWNSVFRANTPFTVEGAALLAS